MNTLFLLFVIFFILKLTNVINWSWWWVISPLLISIFLWLSLVIFGLTTLLFVPILIF